MTMEGSGQLNELTHVGVQINPDEHTVEDVQWSRKCLQKYFRSARAGGRGFAEPEIDIYWGSAADFLLELVKQLASDETDGNESLPTEQGARGGWY